MEESNRKKIIQLFKIIESYDWKVIALELMKDVL